MKKRLPSILVGLLFLVGLGIMIYPTVSNQWNTYRQNKLISNYEKIGVSQDYVFSYEPNDNTEVIDLRPYRQGDAINHIHWNLSTIGDDYIVKQYGSSIESKNIIVADIIPVENEEDRYMLDKLYSALYSVGNVFAENGILSEFAL